MTTTYCAWFIPAAHVAGANAIINMIWQQPLASQNFTRDFNATASPNDPITHYAAHPSLSPEEALVFDNLGGNIPTPAGGWPVTVGQAEVSEADAIAAAAAFRYYRTNDDGADNLAYGAAQLGIQLIKYPPEEF